MTNRKGAIELSMSTIIVVIIGIVLLSLGLMWIRGVMKDITETSKTAFEQADAAISEIYGDVDSLLTIIPSEVTVKKNGDDNVKVVIANFENTGITVNAVVSSSDPMMDCLFADKLDTTSKEYTIESGDQIEIKLIVDEKGGNLGIKTCNVELPGQTGDNTDSLIVRVEK